MPTRPRSRTSPNLLFRFMICQAGDSGCADVAGVAAELCEVDRRAGGGNGERAAADNLPHSLDELAADFVLVAAKVHGAADDDRTWIDDVDQRHDANAQVIGG